MVQEKPKGCTFAKQTEERLPIPLTCFDVAIGGQPMTDFLTLTKFERTVRRLLATPRPSAMKHESESQGKAEAEFQAQGKSEALGPV